MRDGQDVSLGVQKRVFDALLGHWGIERPDVVAHDFGGTTALRTHLLDRRDYRSLVLIDPVRLSPSDSPFVQAAREHQDVFANLPGYIHQRNLRSCISGAVNRELADDEMDRYMAPWEGEVGRSAFYRQIAQMSDAFTDEIQDWYQTIRCPVTLIWGAKNE